MKTTYLTREESIDKLREIVANVPVGVMLSNLTSLPLGANPLEVKTVDNDGGIWFLSSVESDHYSNIMSDKRVQLVFSHPDEMQFLSIYGHAIIYTNRTLLEELYTAIEDQWFDGVHDVKLIGIKVEPSSSFYWDKKQNKFVEFLKNLFSSDSANDSDNETMGRINL